MTETKSGTPARAGRGRAKAVPSTVTAAAKDAIVQAAAQLGGHERIVAWAREDPKNEKTFWTTIYPKLLPLQVNGAGKGGEHLHSLTVKFVRPGS
jgi:hypothetical protein